MEEGQELKHVCKFCSKSFSCGRSLGGHMRSHMINDITAQADGTKLTKKKLPSLVINSNGAINATDTSNSYGLRENPKKTWRISDHPTDQHTSILEKSCKECGKVFQSWKSLFGHMKSHSIEREKLLVMEQEEEDQEEQDSWNSVMDSQSDNETSVAAAPNRRKRSQRRTRQIMGTTANSSSSLCFANNNNNNGSSSVSEIEQEQEEVALCLMMLSRDVGGLNSVAESSDNNSVFLENKIEGGKNCSEIETLTKVESRKTEHSVSGRKGNSTKKKKPQLDDKSAVENSGVELGKRKLSYDSFDPEGNSRFECTTCNKIFHSYQALGGHRASHKKNKGCYASRIDSSENSIETVQLSPDPDESKFKNEISVEFEKRVGGGVETTKKSKTHACPVCFKVFPSGQALGGHKRSHLVANNANEAKNDQNLANQEPIPPPIRDFLDLNLPALDEEDNNNGLMAFNQWWVASTHKHESLVGLISN